MQFHMSRNTKMHAKAFSTHEMVFKRKLSYVSAAVLCEAEDSHGVPTYYGKS